MSSTLELLQDLDDSQLSAIAQEEGLRIPPGKDREYLLDFLSGVLSADSVRKHVTKYTTEEIERETTVKEKIKRKTISSTYSEETKITFDRNRSILELAKAGISRNVLEEILHKNKLPFVYKKHQIEQFEALDDDMLRNLHSSFVLNERDNAGRFFEWRMAKFVQNKYKCDSIKIGQTIHGADDVSYQIDVLGYNADGKLKVICECKARGGSPKREDISKWLRATQQIAKRREYFSLDYSLFASTSPFTQDVVTMVKKDASDGHLKIGGAIGLIVSQYVSVFVLEELAGKIKSIFP